eukprot:TRINITY_DN18359_c0_g1_i1.p1 TRINITY_DN18359_c0_g1~~TRINITY_DN18359_c0_g1_i1.p1  ORF type:complete len:265 (-),score=47.58 TRINITY_DN18359_c0_g1_i1:529-1323(-)
MVFEGRLQQVGVLRRVLEAIKDLVTEANFEVSDNQLTLQAMDSSHVSLVCLEMRQEGFDHFRCDRPMSMGMNIANLLKMLKCAEDNDSVTLRAQDEGSTIQFLFESPNQDRHVDFEMKLMEIDAEQLQVPEQEYKSTVKISASQFQKICRDLGAIGDKVQINVLKGGVTFFTAGDIGQARVTLNVTDDMNEGDKVLTVVMEEPVNASFALKYLNTFTKASPLSRYVTLQLSQDLPIVVSYQIQDFGQIKFYLAPKMDEDNEDED